MFRISASCILRSQVINDLSAAALIRFRGASHTGHWSDKRIIIIIIILSFDIAPFPYKHAQRRITFHCQRIDVDIHIVN